MRAAINRSIVPRGTMSLYMSEQKQSETSQGIEKFVPVFVGAWAIGYTALAAVETSGNGGLGDLGGYIGAGFAVVLLLALVGAAAYEVFKE